MAKKASSRSRSHARPANRRPARRRRNKLSLIDRIRSLPLFTPPEFRPDTQSADMLKTIRFTRLQRLQLLRWVLYAAVCVLCLVVQDVIMAKLRIFGTSTDLAAGIILLITVMEGSSVGSVFVLAASLIYYFSGSAPGPYTVGLLSVIGILMTVFRQQMLHRSTGSILVCTAAAVVGYEVCLYFLGLFLQLTRWTRLPAFILCGLLTSAAMIPMYHLIYRIGQIGGNTWKE